MDHEDNYSDDEIEDMLQHYKAMDLSHCDGHVFGSIYAPPDEIAVKAHTLFIEANLGNRGLYKGTYAMASDIKSIIIPFIHVPEGGELLFTSGGTEANISALWIARKLGCKNVVFGKNAHFSVRKAADILNMNAIEIDMNDDLTIDPEGLRHKLKTVSKSAVVLTAGTTDLGLIDPIAKCCEVCLEHDAFVHIDAAYGGFIIPTLKDLGYIPRDLRFDFEIAAVDTITIDPHKVMGATTPLGALALRHKNYMENLRYHAPYLNTGECTGLLGTHHSASIASFFALWRKMGYHGFKQRVARSMALTRYLVKLLEAKGLELVTEPVMNIVAIKAKRPKNVIKAMGERGWYPSITHLVPGIRMIVFPHHTEDILERFVSALSEVMA